MTNDDKQLKRTLKYQDGVLRASAHLLSTKLNQDNVNMALEALRECTDVSRCYIFKNSVDDSGKLFMHYMYECCGHDATPEINNEDTLALAYEDGFFAWIDRFKKAEPIHGLVTSFPESIQKILLPQGIKSLMLLPIFVSGKWWGFIGFDEIRYERKWYEDEINMLATSSNLFGGYFAQQELQDDLIQSKKIAEHANLEKTLFLANMSHEIRTPLNGISSTISLLKTTNLSSEQKELVDILSQSDFYLLSLVNDLLDISKIESGNITIERAPTNLNSLIKKTISMFHSRAKEKGLTIEFHSDLPMDEINIDPTLVKQVLTNLLNNAIKFTTKGQIKVYAEKYLVDKNDYIGISIIDSGIGIDVDNLENIFDVFKQADNSITRKYGGTGLGLAICKGICSALNGRIYVKNTSSKGTEFRVELPYNIPLTKEHVNSKKDSQHQLDISEVERLKVLIVEDNKINQKLIQKMLKKLGVLHCDVADNGQIGLKATKNIEYDLIFMDVQMPVMDGPTATKMIREHCFRKQPFIYALTANALIESKEECLQAGMNGFITKPVSFKELKKALNDSLCVK